MICTILATNFDRIFFFFIFPSFDNYCTRQNVFTFYKLIFRMFGSSIWLLYFNQPSHYNNSNKKNVAHKNIDQFGKRITAIIIWRKKKQVMCCLHTNFSFRIWNLKATEIDRDWNRFTGPIGSRATSFHRVVLLSFFCNRFRYYYFFFFRSNCLSFALCLFNSLMFSDKID